MKTNAILFANLLSLAATVAGLPTEQAIGTGVTPKTIVYLTLYTQPNYGDPGDSQTLELSTDSCHNLGNRWRDRVRSAWSATRCTYYGRVDCKKEVGWTENGGDPDLKGVYSVRCPR